MLRPFMVFVLMFSATGWAQEWDRFRGPNGSGISSATGLPVTFGPNQNIDWRVEVPFGRSSPILSLDQVVITGTEGQKLITLSLDRKTGQVRWRQELLRDRTQKIFKGNDSATPTPAWDGRNFYVFFPDFGIVSYRPDGKERWQLKLGPFNSFYGVSASPIVHGNMLIQVVDQKKDAFIIVVNKDTGRLRWRKDRPQAKTEAYATPVVWISENGKAQVIVSGAYQIDGYDLDTGRSVWWVGKQGTSPISTPLLVNDLIFSTSTGADKPPYPPWAALMALDKDKDGKISAAECQANAELKDHFGWADRDGDGFLTEAEWNEILKESVSEHGLVAIRAGGSGDQTEKHALWRYEKEYPEITSPLVYQNVLYTVKDGGIVTSLSPVTGTVFKIGRSKDAIDSYFASPVGADGKVYLTSQEGKVSVLKADPQWEVLAVNDLGEECQATPAIGGRSLYIRTSKALYSFSEKR
jgi:outer membrane protein assembly factor BamB